jgi:hypothetical protein
MLGSGGNCRRTMLHLGQHGLSRESQVSQFLCFPRRKTLVSTIYIDCPTSRRSDESRTTASARTANVVLRSSMTSRDQNTSLVATMVRHVERKALQIHNLYLLIKGTKNILHSLYAVDTLHGGIGRSLLWKTGDTHSLFAKGKSLNSEGIGMPRDKMAIA